MINQREFFDSMAEKWDEVCQHDTDKIEKILNLINIQNGDKILDVGTGTGILIPFLREQVGEQGKIVAIDVSKKMLEIAERKYTYDNVSFVCDDVLKSDLPSQYFDYAICYSVFPHFENKKIAIENLSSYLKEAGKLMVCHSQSREEINKLHRNASKAVAEDNLPTTDEFKECFSELNLETIIEIDNDEMFVMVCSKK